MSIPSSRIAKPSANDQNGPSGQALWPRIRSGIHRGAQSFLYVTLTLATGLILWQLTVVIFHIPSYILPRPYPVFRLIAVARAELISDILVTAKEALLGIGAAIIVGVSGALLIVTSKRIGRFIYMIFIWSQVVPKVAIAPLFVIWFGFGFLPKVLVAFLISFFPIIVDSVAGLVSVDQKFSTLSRSMGARPVQQFWKIRLPGALPYFFSGLKTAVTLAVVGAVVSEFIGADSGLGYVLVSSMSNLDTALVFASILLMSALGLLLFLAVELAERLLIPWHHSQGGPIGTAKESL